jgi:hypothetical protein
VDEMVTTPFILVIFKVPLRRPKALPDLLLELGIEVPF